MAFFIEILQSTFLKVLTSIIFMKSLRFRSFNSQCQKMLCLSWVNGIFFVLLTLNLVPIQVFFFPWLPGIREPNLMLTSTNWIKHCVMNLSVLIYPGYLTFIFIFSYFFIFMSYHKVCFYKSYIKVISTYNL